MNKKKSCGGCEKPECGCQLDPPELDDVDFPTQTIGTNLMMQASASLEREVEEDLKAADGSLKDILEEEENSGNPRGRRGK